MVRARKLAELDETALKKAYRRWAPVYDRTFGKIAEAGIRDTAARANAFEGRLIEAGVGTGLSLPLYRPGLTVTGVDLSPDMLTKARERVAALALGHVEALLEMDAASLAFPDASFDAAVAMYVMTVVPDPEKVMRELARVVRPGGAVLVCNHFSVEKGLRAAIEKRLAGFADILGWRPEFPLETLLAAPDLELVSKTPVRPFGFFTLLEFRRV